MRKASMIDYHINRINLDEDEPEYRLPEVDQSKLLDYVVASNGVFARGRRPGLEVCMPITVALDDIRGLEPCEPYAQWGFPRVPLALVEAMLMVSRNVCRQMPREALFHLCFDRSEEFQQTCSAHLLCHDGWHLEFPEQVPVSPARVVDSIKPVHCGEGTSTARAVIEVHSHHSMSAEFSDEDNIDESQGFRIYAVLGDIFQHAKIRARVGLFGHFFEYIAGEFFELPDGLEDCLAVTVNP